MDFSTTEDDSIIAGGATSQNDMYDDLNSMTSAILRRDLIKVVDWAMGSCDEIALHSVHELVTGGPCLHSPVYEEPLQDQSPSTMVEVSFDGFKNTIAYCSDDDESSVTEVWEGAEEHEQEDSRKMIYLRSEYSQQSMMDAPRRFDLLQNLRSTGSRMRKSS
jgi:hypothetical protein